jgi:hypothetical protein
MLNLLGADRYGGGPDSRGVGSGGEPHQSTEQIQVVHVTHTAPIRTQQRHFENLIVRHDLKKHYRDPDVSTGKRDKKKGKRKKKRKKEKKKKKGPLTTNERLEGAGAVREGLLHPKRRPG